MDIGQFPDHLYQHIGNYNQDGDHFVVYFNTNVSAENLEQYANDVCIHLSDRGAPGMGIQNNNNGSFTISYLNPEPVQPVQQEQPQPRRYVPPTGNTGNTGLAVGNGFIQEAVPMDPIPQQDNDEYDDDELENVEELDENGPDQDYGIVTPDRISVVIGSQMNNSTTNIARELSDAMVDYDNAENRLIEIRRRVDSLTANLDSDNTVQSLLDKMTRLRDHPKVADVSVTTENCIAIRTRDLITENEFDGAKRRIGVLSIHIPINILARTSNLEGRIKVRNHTHTFDNFQAPHISNNGVCVGNAREAIRDAVVNLEIGTVVDAIIALVTRPDAADAWGRRVLRFPRVQG
jgi:hypothetical protein